MSNKHNYVSKLDKNRRIVIPESILNKAEISTGDLIIVKAKDNHLLIDLSRAIKNI
ncbi:AbrB/MazE/SpoVT family DNA-binding domain-containing protein [Alkalicoccus luteus]|uniref:AbrB/MazE/SpoVT family DNA-binding domain-containing protein n=1 Tax=Alkalicoccus luteus TaxID=1237094 RepID=A0A969TYP8_9BACI|nr:AbrB/MazE/SpoVT family DNA-binding domain-containing protein [Alkalicoccus luteus]NJP39369.1 AbrB/MazE/SpoVT family DNA-binding domain-containing protein [Alkalicoccus luteus]